MALRRARQHPAQVLALPVQDQVVEAAQAADRHIDRAGGQVLLPGQVEQVILDLLVPDQLRGLVVVRGQVPNGADIGVLGLG